MASDPALDPKVKKKLVAVLAAWQAQFKDDPSMSLVAGLYKQCRLDTHRQSSIQPSAAAQGLALEAEHERKAHEERERKREEEKRKAKEEERHRKEEEERRKKMEKEKKKAIATQPKVKRKVFNFEEVSINVTSYASSGANRDLINEGETSNPNYYSECITSLQ